MNWSIENVNTMKKLILISFLGIVFTGQAVVTASEHDSSVKPRVIVASDGETDDVCSMIRFLPYSNEFDIEGDSPSFLYLVSANQGINNPEDPTQPGWGGQYVRKGNTNHYVDGPGDSSISRWKNDFQSEFRERADWCK